MRLIDVRKIWHQAPHNAFTDLIRFQGRWYCAFREASAHRSVDGKLRVIRSDDWINWSPVTLMEWADGDIRDAKLSITPQNQLMLHSVVMFNPPSRGKPRQPVAWLSPNGTDWSPAYADPIALGAYPWSVTWHNGIGYCPAYFGLESARPGGCLYQTLDGKTWKALANTMFPVAANGFGNEASLVFGPHDVACCLLRRDPLPYDSGSIPDAPGSSGQLGFAQPPYTEWTWKDLGVRIGGPKIIYLNDGRLLAAVRLYVGTRRHALCWVDANKIALIEFLTLPSGGDCGYAGVVEHDGVIWVSYYSSHEGQTAIYLAKIKTM